MRLSADGRFVVFESTATNLVQGKSSGFVADVFVRDRDLGLTERVSLTWDGLEPNHHCTSPVISADGRFVAFESSASNLVPGDTNGNSDIFVKDRWLDSLEIVSVSSAGEISNGACYRPSISGDGSLVAFESYASNLVPDDPNAYTDVFVHERRARTTECVSRDRSGRIRNGASGQPAISLDGRIVAFFSTAKLVPHDSTTYADIYLYHRENREPYLASLTWTGSQANRGSGGAQLSADGRVVVFWSTADNLVPGDTNRRPDVFAHDAATGLTEAVGVDEAGQLREKGSDFGTGVSADGRFVAFEAGGRMVSHDRNKADDIFVRDRLYRTTERASEPTGGGEGDRASFSPALSADGRVVAFASAATNLVLGDTNGVTGVFVHERGGAQSADGITLSGPSSAATGEAVALTWSGAAAGSRYWVLASESVSGRMVGGHFLLLGDPALVIADGVHGAAGTGAHTTRPVPPGWVGRSVFFEIASFSPAGEARDSNVVAVEIR